MLCRLPLLGPGAEATETSGSGGAHQGANLNAHSADCLDWDGPGRADHAAVIGDRGEGFEVWLFLGEVLLGPAAGLAVETHVGDGVEPVTGSGMDGGEAGDFQAVEEVLLHIADARFDAALRVCAFDVTRHGQEAVVGGEVQVTGMELGALAQGMLEDADLEVVDHYPPGGNRAEELEGMAVAGEELFRAFGQGELAVEQTAVAEEIGTNRAFVDHGLRALVPGR